MKAATRQLVIFLGPPGSGKGSLSQLCVESFGWKQLSTGFLCRKHIKEQTEIGKQIDFFIKSGKLISDKLIVDMVEQWLEESTQQDSFIILDGFPRNIVQAEALHEIIDKKRFFFKIEIFKLFVSDEIVLQRLLARYICDNKDCQAVYSMNTAGLKPKEIGICNHCFAKLIRRSDDEGKTIRNRIDTYRIHEKGLVDFYALKGLKVNEINVEKSLDMVFQNFKNMITRSSI